LVGLCRLRQPLEFLALAHQRRQSHLVLHRGRRGRRGRRGL
jgi:hypothetical protein